MIQITIRPQFEKDLSADFVQRVAAAALAHESMAAEADLSIVITGDDEIHTLNARFRDVDAPTDVLAFVEEETDQPFVIAPDKLPYLGDIVISFSRAQAQAQDQGHSVEQELALLVVHGILHLLGYDHGTAYDKERMWTRQDTILTALDLS